MAGELPAGAAFDVDQQTRRRQPSELALDAIAPLATLPVFFKLVGKRVVVAGASEAAAWKAELLAAAGARVDIFADAPSLKMIDVAGRNSAIRIVERDWTPQDLSDAAIAVGDFVDPNHSRAFRAAARAAGAAVNVIDQPEFCDFAFGSIVNRSPLVIAISTDGAAPVFGQALRARIEALTPQTFSAWAAAAKAWRGKVRALALGFRQRRRFWERFTALAFANADRPPTDGDRDGLLAEARGEPAQSGKGEVVLVGAGPGDAELLTLKALRLLQSATIVLHDSLVSPEILALIPATTERIDVGKRRGHGACQIGFRPPA